MNELSKLYQLVLNRELDIPKGQILDIKKIDHKLLAFMQCVYNTGELGHVYTFWDKDTQVDQNALLDTYIEGMRLLMSIAYDLQIDEIKNHEEMPEKSSSVDLLFYCCCKGNKDFFKVNHDILDLRNGYSPIKLQDALDDYFHFGFSLGITFDDMLEGL